MRLAEIPEDEFEAILAKNRAEGRRSTTNTVLRIAGKLSPDRARPHERARLEAVEHLESAAGLLDRLSRTLRETGSDTELAQSQAAFAAVMHALRALVRLPARGSQNRL